MVVSEFQVVRRVGVGMKGTKCDWEIFVSGPFNNKGLAFC